MSAQTIEEAGYTAEEASGLKGLSRSQFETMPPRERKSFFSFINHNKVMLAI